MVVVSKYIIGGDDKITYLFRATGVRRGGPWEQRG